MRKFLLSALIAFPFSFAATAQQFHWGKQAVSNLDIATDRAGNIYTLGFVIGGGSPVDVDPGPGVANVPTSMVGFNCPYVLKYNKQGDIVWMHVVNAQAYQEDWEITVDEAQNVYVASSINVSMFDPGTIGRIEKINSNGSTGWEITLGTGSTFQHTFCRDIAVDSVGNVYVSGRSGPSIDVDPGPNTVNLSGPFIVKYTGAGDYVSHILGGGQLIEVSRDGNSIYTVEPIGFMVTWPLNIMKRNGSGTQLWSHPLDSLTYVRMNITEPGNIYVTGYFVDTVDADPGPGVTELLTAGGKDQFLLKMDSAGNFIWAKQMGSLSKDQGMGLELDGEGNIYTCGVFSGTVDMDPNTGVENLVSMTPDTTDIFVQKLDAAGNYVWAVPIATNWINESFGMAIDTAGAIIIIGEANGADVNPGTPSVLINANNFITKWSDTTVIVSVGSIANEEHNFVVYPNPSAKTINVSAGQVIDNITITDIAGKVVYVATPVSKKVSVEILQPGMYFVNVTSGDKVSARKVLIQ